MVLNADTVVTAGWLERLVDAAAAPDVATVTPLTCFGSICTLPRPVIDAFDLFGDEPRIDECAEFVGRYSAGVRPEVITGVGFCMYVTREALDRCGIFDEEAFGRGYGEEVDFCLRATRHGFRHLVEDATYVHHHGGVSFADERAKRHRPARPSCIHKRYPTFPEDNKRERAHEPLAVSFASLELGLSERDPAGRTSSSCSTARPAPSAAPRSTSPRCSRRWPTSSTSRCCTPSSPASCCAPCGADPTAPPPSSSSSCRVACAGRPRPTTRRPRRRWRWSLDWFDFDAVHIQNLIGYSLAPLDVLADFDGPVVCSVRDLFLACPNHSLLYLRPPGLRHPRRPLLLRQVPSRDQAPRRRRAGGVPRAAGRGALDTVDTWVFATQSAADYLLRAYDIDPDRIQIITHGAVIPTVRHQPVDEDLVLHEPLRIAFVGRGWSKKGLDTVNHLADQLADTPIEIHHFGELVEPASAELRVHGTYDNQFLPDLLRLAGIHIVLLPGHYAETFGHVMTESLIAGIPIIGATYGALGERIRTHGVGWTIDPDDPDELHTLIRRLDTARFEILRATRRADAVPLRAVDETAGDYAALYSDRARRPHVMTALVRAAGSAEVRAGETT